MSRATFGIPLSFESVSDLFIRVILKHGLHLAYCTNVHRGGDWPETLASLEQHTLAVRDSVSPDGPYAIGLRLSDRASRQLLQTDALNHFRNWLARNRCYVFTINGFPYGDFHGARVKEKVSQPDWSSQERLDYTLRLFDILAELVPAGIGGSVSTVPVSFKQFDLGEEGLKISRQNLWRCVEHLDRLGQRTGQLFHLGLEPEPFGTVENTDEFIGLMDQIEAEHIGDSRLWRHLGINYDTCHFALQFEDPRHSLIRLRDRGVRISKLHLSNALRVQPTEAVRELLKPFLDQVYFHQVIERRPSGELRRYPDLDRALEIAARERHDGTGEWRIHFHIPLHAPETAILGTTADHIRGALDVLQDDPSICSHLEMETYTWEVLPPKLRQPTVEKMLIGEYSWTLAQLNSRGLGPMAV